MSIADFSMRDGSLNVFRAQGTSRSGRSGPVPRDERRSETDPPPNIEEARRRIAQVSAEGLDELDLGVSTSARYRRKCLRSRTSRP